MKVLLKFLLLERQRLALADVPALLASIPLVEHAARRTLGVSAAELADWTVQSLLRAGAVRIKQDQLVDA